MADPAAEFVFGYGSLAGWLAAGISRAASARGFVTDVVGARRTWGVAMDNRRDLPGYKYYTGPDGTRPEVFVAFLDLRCAGDAGARVNGVCVPVDDEDLVMLDRRERNYRRIDITHRVAASRPGAARIWAYAGSASARERFRQGHTTGAAVVDANYVRGVHAAFARLGESERRACAPSLETGDLPVVSLQRHDLP